MPTKTTVFADRIANITVTGNLVRLDLAVLDQLPKQEGDAPLFEVTHRLVLPLEGFVASLQSQDAVVQRLLADGVLKKRPAEPTQVN